MTKETGEIRGSVVRIAAVLAFLVLSVSTIRLVAQSTRTLDIYFIDTEGGQSTLVVAPSGESLVIDAGFAGDRDADRITAAAKMAGVTTINNLLITHHHEDHEGGVPDLLKRMPVQRFLDHGPTVEPKRPSYEAYEMAAASRPRRVLVPGDTIGMRDLDIRVVTSAGRFVDAAGGENPYCQGLEPRTEPVPWENPQSVGIVLQFGRFRFVDLGDLPWNASLEFFCPTNRIAPPIDLSLSPHHGTAVTPKAEWAMRPRVTVMNNGARKGGDPLSWRTLRDSPGLEDLWQLHFSIAGGMDYNVQDRFIANLEGGMDGHYLRASASEDGSFTIFNARTGETKRYAARQTP